MTNPMTTAEVTAWLRRRATSQCPNHQHNYAAVVCGLCNSTGVYVDVKIATAADLIESLTAERDKKEISHLATIGERDAHEERINAIGSALGLDEAGMTWSSQSDVGENCIEAIERLTADAAALATLQRIDDLNQSALREAGAPYVHQTTEGIGWLIAERDALQERDNRWLDTFRAIAVDGAGLTDPYAPHDDEYPKDWAENEYLSQTVRKIREERDALAGMVMQLREALEKIALQKLLPHMAESVADTALALELPAAVAQVQKWKKQARLPDWANKHVDSVDRSGIGADDSWVEVLYMDGNKAEGATLIEALEDAQSNPAKEAENAK